MINPTSEHPQLSTWQRFWLHPVTRVIMFGLLTLVIALPVPTALVIVLAIRGQVTMNVFWTHSGPVWDIILFWSEASQAVAALAALGIMAQLPGSKPFRDYGLKLKHAARELALGVLIGAAMMSAVFGVLYVCGWCHLTGMLTGPRVITALGTALLLFFTVAVFEEVTFRGYVFQTFEMRWGSKAAIIITMVIFGLIHVMNLPTDATPMQRWTGPIFISFEAGLLFAALYLWTRRLWLPIGVHWAWNFFQGPVYGAHVSGTNFGQTWLNTQFTGPTWATGGTFGPEAGVPALVIGTTLGLILLYRVRRSDNWMMPPAMRKVRLPATHSGAQGN